MIDKSFFTFLSSQLSQVMGPVAEVMVEDEIKEMGETLQKFPIKRAPDLIIFLSRQIPREEKKLMFLQAMISKINELKITSLLG